jgi:hypothetical protein
MWRLHAARALILQTDTRVCGCASLSGSPGRPGFYWENAKRITYDPSPGSGTGELLEVYPDGTIWWSLQQTFLLACSFSSTSNLPFDTHACNYRMGSYSENAADAIVRWRTGEQGLANIDGPCMREWFVTGYEQEDVLDVYVGANYTFASATIMLSRSPTIMLYSYLLPSVLMVVCSFFGFFIDPLATPARVSLAMLAIVVSASSFLALASSIPKTTSVPWLGRVLLVSLTFNWCSMLEVVLVSFGSLSGKWLRDQKVLLRQQMPLHTLLRSECDALIKEWDLDGDGTVSKSEFRKGVRKLGLGTSAAEANDAFDTFDTEKQGILPIDFLERKIRAAPVSAKARLGSGSSSMTTSAAEMSEEEAMANDMEIEVGEEAVELASPTVGAKSIALQVDAVCVEPMRIEGEGTSSLREANVPQGRLAQRWPPQLKRSKTLMSQKTVAKHVSTNLDLGYLWRFKVFRLFPYLKKLKRLDHYARLSFPTAFTIYILVACQEVRFFQPHYVLLQNSTCFVNPR